MGLPVSEPEILAAQRHLDAVVTARAKTRTAGIEGKLPLKMHTAKAQLDAYMDSPAWAEMRGLERRLAATHNTQELFHLDGYCDACDTPTVFLVDRQAGATVEDGVWIPNWRERLVCASCQLNNRQRLITRVTGDVIDARGREPLTAYLTEQVTPIFRFLADHYPHVRWIGSEYLGGDKQPGETVNGIRHEDIERLSFADASLDVIVSNDVLEHVNDPDAAFREIARVLRSGGHLLMTIPFHWGLEQSVRRARLGPSGVTHLLPPQYHGNPVSADGSLVFTDFGWDVLTQLAAAGLKSPRFVVCWSPRYGHLGTNVGFFQAERV
jgi:hypothetical protein